MSTRAVGPHFLERRSGKLIIISSFSGVHGRPNLTLYSLRAKSGLIGFARSLALEWAPYGIQVNGICPGTFPDPVTTGEEGYLQAVGAARTSVPVRREGRLQRGWSPGPISGLFCIRLHDRSDALPSMENF